MRRESGVLFLFLLVPVVSLPLSGAHLDALPLIPFNGPQQASPPYAFDGAYANYTLTYYTQEGPYVYLSSFVVSEVNAGAQTFSVKSLYNSYLAPFDAVDNVTFQQPIPFPAASPSQLQLFKEGKTPVGYYKDNITSNVLVNTPAGRFVTYKVEAPVSTVWFDSRTGLLVQEHGLMLGEGNGGFVGLVLDSTNIKPDDSGPVRVYILATLMVAAAATGAVISSALNSSRTRQRDATPVVSGGTS